ncbi:MULTISPECIES: S-layer homology domain-containing protein [Paenibacillus]|uniref:S-layer homology domain-containing protein n=1 Tax=Paenibacillus TaxID=44249 RepID=UPI0022B8EB02|nr:S-layer homology domain-containing protein [Paenibacillus caseinilyticus]MCZ8519512.1 S-layer homology domain-containing protein [Paenibacillus caseinilyticus]
MKKTLMTFLSLALVWMTLLPFAASAAAPGEVRIAAAKKADDFKDLAGLPKDQKDKFNTLLSEGVFNGLSDDTFGLDVQMNRAQFAKVASIIFKLPVDGTLTSSSFKDVSANDPANSYALPYIEALKKAGLTNGYDAEGVLYNPAGPVSRQELSAFLIRGLGLEEAASSAAPVADATVADWAKPYVALALEKKLMTAEGGSFDGTSPATRRMLALASYEAKNLLAGGSADAPEKPAAGTQDKEEPAAKPDDKPDTSKDDEPAATVSPKGKKLLIVGREKAAEDVIIGDRLKAQGFVVSYLIDRRLSPERIKGFDLIFISETTNSKYVKENLDHMKTLEIPVIYNKAIAMGDLGMSSTSENSSVEKVKKITIKDASHPIAAGVTGSLDVYTEDGRIDYGVPGKSATVIATVAGDEKKAAIYTYEKGSKNMKGETVPARTVFFYMAAGMSGKTTNDAWKIFEASFLWALQSK